ncbi:MAG: hypothetical protein KDD75_10595, partial [Caldilineaceae bacterium]|nr:hypothetical protein [Caldilineaceae bacterium]
TLNIAGSLLLALISIVDLILELAGLDFTLMGGLADVLAGIIYRFKIYDKYDIDAGTIRTHLADPELGFVAGNALATSLPITTTLSRNFFSGEGLTDHSFRFELNNRQNTVKTKLGDRANDYTLLVEPLEPSGAYNAYQAQVVDAPTYTQTLQAGVNQTINVHLNSGYALRGTECWFIFCSSRTVDGSTSEFLGKIMVMDVLPATLDDFVQVNQWGRTRAGGVRFLDADGDGLLPTSAGGLDRDDTKWDSDGDGLNDAYEVFLRSKPVSEGGILLDPNSADTDNDGVRDDVELRYGTDPAHSDTDGDGLDDAAELPPNGGWMIPFRYDAASQKVTETRVWSDPLHADVDGDGLSDLFERTRLTCPTCNPWADPANPQVTNPNVWNESPVALYIANDTPDDFVAPGATVVYTTTTQNNLGLGQELVGDLSLAVPAGVNGGPLVAPVNILNGERASLVSNLTFPGQNSAAYDLSSRMDLTNFFETRWAWEGLTATGQNALSGAVESIAVTPVNGWEVPFVVATSERTATALTINAYMVTSDGAVVKSTTMRTSAAVAGRLTGPDIACNDEGTCLIVWGEG